LLLAAQTLLASADRMINQNGGNFFAQAAMAASSV